MTTVVESRRARKKTKRKKERGRGKGAWVIAATICSTRRIYFYRYNLLREIKYFENKREDACDRAPWYRRPFVLRGRHAFRREIFPRVCTRLYLLFLFARIHVCCWSGQPCNWGSAVEKHQGTGSETDAICNPVIPAACVWRYNGSKLTSDNF